MAKTRLNNNHRDILLRHAVSTIKFPELQDAADKAYEVAAKHVRAAVEKRFPKRDMKVLEKYSVSQVDTCIQCADLETSRVFRFDFTDQKGAPVVPRRYCSSRNIGLEPDAVAACETYELARNAAKDAKDAMKRDFRSLFHSSKTIEDVIAVWPEAGAVANRIRAGTTAVVSAELIDRVKSYSKAA